MIENNINIIICFPTDPTKIIYNFDSDSLWRIQLMIIKG